MERAARFVSSGRTGWTTHTGSRGRVTSTSRRSSCVVYFLLLSAFLSSANSLAAEPCEPIVGRLVSVEGRVEVQRAQNQEWRAAQLEEVICQGDTVRTSAHSRAAVALINDAVLRIDQRTTLQLVDIVEEETERSLIDLIFGAFQSFSRKPRLLTVSTPYLNGSIEGTEFVFRVDDNRTLLTVFEGQVLAANELGSISVARNESVAAEAGQAPAPQILVRPRDAVQWALFYPPLLGALGGGKQAEPTDVAPALQDALRMAGAGDPPGALTALDEVALAHRDADFFILRAAILLSVGQVAAARADIDQALNVDPNAGRAFALRAVIGVVQNDRDQALADGNRAVTVSPNSAAAHIALSYAQQASFQITAARDTLLQAVEQQPEDPLAWARLGELWLMLGNSRESRAAAQKATELAPNLARTQLVLGFAALAEFRNADALAAFERAIELSSADPLAHLGLGLAKVSSGKLEQGRADLEVAVALDSNSSLLRAYLGKAYFEERRYPLDSEQYNIAKQLDPNDPTAYLYDGILKQTINRPIEAVEDLERSIELNDNRAVYRSRLLLDKDRAARGTSLARAYKDLGFTQLGINQSAQSLVLDPSNASAHRFLSDTYFGVRRHEIARVSELLQAQLMQDINVNPVQPSVAEANLNIVTLGGPASAGFNEFTPLFQRNKSQFNITGVGGSNDTYGGEAVASGLYNNVSYSAGAFTSNSDGWRENNDLSQDIYNIYLQAAVTPKLNIQGELSHRESEQGDLAFNFDPNDFLTDSILESDRDTARVGLRYSPSEQSEFIFSYIYSDLDRFSDVVDPVDPATTIFSRVDFDTAGSLVEGQYVYEGERFNIVTGAAYGDSETDVDDFFEVVITGVGPVFSASTTLKEEIEHPRVYLYSNLQSADSVTWTVGASYDDFRQDPIEETSFNPKLGVQWDVTDRLRLRAAGFKVLRPSLINNRTIEPTQVAGFNQFFDDSIGTESWRYGVGLDQRVSQQLSWGAELSSRDLDEPNVVLEETGQESVFQEEQDEELHRLYVYWTPTNRIGASGSLVYDRFESEKGDNTRFTNRPEKLTTVSLPVVVTYSHPNGWFAALGGTYVDQDVTRDPSSTFVQGDDSFFLVDLAVGYRFAKRRGVASLGVKNLFDEEFMYQDDSFREFSEDATTGPYFPDRIILGRVTLSF